MPVESTRGRVLFVDDDDISLAMYSGPLGALNYEVVECSDGSTAIEALRRSSFDAVVTDLRMPGVDGLELLRRVRQVDYDLPLLILTAKPDIESAVAAVELGVHQYLTKPVTREVFAAAVERSVNLGRLARAKRQSLELLQGVPASEMMSLGARFDECLRSLWVAFQPIVTADRDGGPTLYGYEALLRSREPSLPTPPAVLQAAERLGCIREVGRRVREIALGAFVDAPRDVVLFLNLHASDLLDDALLALVTQHRKLASRLVFEVTERASLEQVPDARERAAALRQLGCRIAVDDLGAGYAGLSSFVLLEPDIVKLDMSLVRGADQSPLKQKLIGSLTNVCLDMGLSVVAEGIETPAERDVMMELGCTHLQGFLFGAPSAPFAAPIL